eukprot:CAMPEP_0172524414 /NCGR_PEP_ID=MMETSP1066-20121228/294176_1 /TAXON_ID=671091 /ORGANISM="Coscinodiscus wailesii, Strain CCMP2513" /LENGTH=32 /DNA_ID= /DNA_START= /DNA_END= /DNA_ORIENTATION=
MPVLSTPPFGKSSLSMQMEMIAKFVMQMKDIF